MRLAVTGSAARQIRIATTLNGTNCSGSDMPNRAWPSASAPRLTTMYIANTPLRCAGGAVALSQLSITVYRPTSAIPVSIRSAAQAQGESMIACSSTDTAARAAWNAKARSEEHTSELQSLMRISYAVFCLKNKTQNKDTD